MALSENNFEDWDFRGCFPGSPNYDAEADLFLSTHYTTVVAVDLMRLNIIKTLLDGGWAHVSEDGKDVVFDLLPNAVDPWLRGMRSSASRLTRDGRFVRSVYNGLRREHAKYGLLRLTILPSTESGQAGWQEFTD